MSDGLLIGGASPPLVIRRGNQTIKVGDGDQTIVVRRGTQTIAVGDGDQTILVRSQGAQVLQIGGGSQTLKIGNAQLALQRWPGKGSSIADITTGSKFWIGKTPAALTVAEINAVLQGSAGQSVTWELRFAADFSTAGTLIHGEITTNITSGVDITSINGTAALPAGVHVWFEFTATAGTVDAFNAQIRI